MPQETKYKAARLQLHLSVIVSSMTVAWGISHPCFLYHESSMTRLFVSSTNITKASIFSKSVVTDSVTLKQVCYISDMLTD